MAQEPALSGRLRQTGLPFTTRPTWPEGHRSADREKQVPSTSTPAEGGKGSTAHGPHVCRSAQRKASAHGESASQSKNRHGVPHTSKTQETGCTSAAVQ